MNKASSGFVDDQEKPHDKQNVTLAMTVLYLSRSIVGRGSEHKDLEGV